ncbi:MAG: hypothetical protein AUG51_16020 [Acidobacteria bacterium 13_1_20CM_3_53_8]|nr:MAG: hypothetical protein AUG51_16020 [Acidobacteria bacterium 13_1_20CM_3_53_8]
MGETFHRTIFECIEALRALLDGCPRALLLLQPVQTVWLVEVGGQKAIALRKRIESVPKKFVNRVRASGAGT